MSGESGSDGHTHFEVLILDQRPKLVQAARKLLHDAGEAEDVVQETLTAVWKRLPEIPERKLGAYLFRAVRFNSLKRRARRKERVSLELVGEPSARPPGREPEEMIGPFELERGLAGLPETQQAVLRLKYYVGLTFREIGEVLSISANTAASRCRYALTALRRALGRERTKPTGKGGEGT